MQKKFFVRYTNTARLKIETCSDPDKKSLLECAAKRAQIMESAIKLHRSWLFRSGCQEKALSEFDSQWRVMLQFSMSAPVQEFKCDFLWDLRLQILAARCCLQMLPIRSISSISIG